MARFSLDGVVESSATEKASTATTTNTNTTKEEEEEEPPHPLGFACCRYGLTSSTGATSVQHYKMKHRYKHTDHHHYDPELLTSPPKYPPLQHFHSPFIHREILASVTSTTTPPQETCPVDETLDKLRLSLQTNRIRNSSSTLNSWMTSSTPAVLLSSSSQYHDHDLVQHHKQRYQQEHDEDRQALDKIVRDVLATIQQEQQQQAQREEEKQLQEQQRAQKKLQEKQDARKKAEEQAKRNKELAEAKPNKPVPATTSTADYVQKAQYLIAQLPKIRASVEPFEKNKTVAKRRLQMKKIVNGKINTLTEEAHKIIQVARDVTHTIEEARAQDEQIKEQIKTGNASIAPEVARGKRYFLDLLASKVIVRAQAESFNGQRGDGFPLAAMLAQCANESKDLCPILAAHIYTVCPVCIPRLPSDVSSESDEAFMEELGMLRKPDGEFETFERFLTRTEGVVSLMADIMSSNPPTHSLMGGHPGAIKWLDRFLSLLPDPPTKPLPLLTAPVLDAFLKRAGHMLANQHEQEFVPLLNKIQTQVMNRLDDSAIGSPSATRLKKTVSGNLEHFRRTLPSRAIGELYVGSGVTASAISVGAGTTGSLSTGGQSKKSNFSSSPFGGANTRNSGMGQGNTTFASPFGGPTMTSTASSNQMDDDYTNTSTFGQNSVSSSKTFGQSPFGATPSLAQPSSNSFGQPSGFGQQGSSQGHSPFGGGGNSNFSQAPSPSPFGGGSSTISSPFGSNQSNNAPATPFGMQSSGPSAPFGTNQSNSMSSSPFGMQSSGPSAPFGSNQSNSMSSSPFGMQSSVPSSLGNNSQFGQAQSSTTSSFGVGNSPFGTGYTPNPSPFGASQGGGFGASSARPSPFGSSTSGSNQLNSNTASPFSGTSKSNRPLCKYFAQGRCQFGSNCRFSHEKPGR